MSELIDAALGSIDCDLFIKNGSLVNVLTNEVYPANVGIKSNRIVYVGQETLPSFQSVDAAERFLAPGLIDAHFHFESTMLTLSELCKALIPRGTTTLVVDPHEIANVMGLRGIKLVFEEAQHLPIKVFLMVPSCVPATRMETSGAEVTPQDVSELLELEGVLGLAEVMDFPAVLSKDQDMLAKIDASKNKIIDGHCPGLTGKELCAYLTQGISSDHEVTSVEEAKEKLRLGMQVMVREGSGAKNLQALLPILQFHGTVLVTDDVTPMDLLKKGHLDYVVRKAIENGIDPLRAIQMVTINPARYFGLRDYGAIAPSKIANLLILKDLKTFDVEATIVKGKVFYHAGRFLLEFKRFEYPRENSIKLKRPIQPEDLEIRSNLPEVEVKAIRVVEDQILTKKLAAKLKVQKFYVEPDVEKDILKVSVLERHRRTGNIGNGWVSGFGLKEGAIASSVAHDSHNIITLGANASDMSVAVNHLAKVGGGLVVVRRQRILGSLELPIAGLISDRTSDDVVKKLGMLKRAVVELGCELENPFMTLSFLALPVIPEIRITDRGPVELS